MGYFLVPDLARHNYGTIADNGENPSEVENDTETNQDENEDEVEPAESDDAEQEDEVPPEPPEFIPNHVPVPDSVRSIYMTSWVAGTPSIREPIVDLILETEINSIVIDIKDDTGKISFDVYDPFLDEFGAEEIRIPDLREFIDRLHDNGIYVIGRISTFQDPYFVSQRPDLAVKRASDGGVWEDRKGLTWIDAGAKEAWDYLVAIGKESYRAGFDELNYDYIRFPTDGNMEDIYYPFSEETLTNNYLGRTIVMKEFFEYLSTELRSVQSVS